MIAEGLQYLHSFDKAIVHGDLRGVSVRLPAESLSPILKQLQANILIDRTGSPRIADFGLTQFTLGVLSTRWDSPSSGKEPIPNWDAPELLDPDQDSEEIVIATKETDVCPDQGTEAMVIATKETDVYSFACVCIEV